MTWDKTLEIGVKQVDDQHKELFERANALLTAGRNQKGREEIQKTMDFLQAYCVKHFHDEEELQRAVGYPKYQEHKKMHDNYIQTLDSLRARYQAEGDTLNIVLAVNKTVVDWLINHINVHDRDLAVYYRNKA